VSLLLGDDAYRTSARRVQAEIAAMPGPEDGVSLLERLARERRPLVRPRGDRPPEGVQQ
jgi:hypothetical protein